MNEHTLLSMADAAYLIVGAVNWPWYVLGAIVLLAANILWWRWHRLRA